MYVEKVKREWSLFGEFLIPAGIRWVLGKVSEKNLFIWGTSFKQYLGRSKALNYSHNDNVLLQRSETVANAPSSPKLQSFRRSLGQLWPGANILGQL